MKNIYGWFASKFLKSSKFWLGVAGAIAVFLKDNFGLEETQVMQVLTIIIAMITGKAIEDHGRNANPSNKRPD